MQAVIMAGGKGTRLSSVLQDIPKPMAPLLGKPLLEYQIENLRREKITDIIIIVGYLGYVIKDYFGNGSRHGVHITYFEEEEPLGTAGALYQIRERLKETFLLLFGDLFLDIDFQRFYGYHQMKKAAVTLYVHPNSHPFDSDLVVTDREDRVVEWSYKNMKRREDYRNLVNAGIYIITKSILDRKPGSRKVDLEKQVIVPLVSRRCVYAYSCTEYVKDIGTPERLQRVELDIAHGICEQRNLRNRQKCIFLDRDGTINQYVGFLTDPSEMVLEERAAEAIRLINSSKYLAVVVSNQPVVARGECSIERLEAIHNRMYTLLGERRAYVDRLYYCPHHPHSGYPGEVAALKIKCDCRKPEIGMLRQAERELNIDLSQSWIIGDTTSDIKTGRNAGVRTALVRTGEAGGDGKCSVKPDIEAEDLLECVTEILRRDGMI